MGYNTCTSTRIRRLIEFRDNFDASGNRRIDGLHLYTFAPRSKQYFENFIRLSILF
jgi:hypothetical protein